MRLTYGNYRKFFGRSVRKASFFGSGLSDEAAKAICR